MANTANTANTARKTASQRAQDRVLNGHDCGVSDAEIKGKMDRAPGTKDEAAGASEATKTQYAYSAYCASLGILSTDAPAISFKNCIAGFIASLCAMVVGYAVGLQIVDLIAYGAFLLTGWAYLSIAIMVIGWVITLICSLYAGGKVAAYVGTGAYVKDMERVGSWFKSKFTSVKAAI